VAVLELGATAGNGTGLTPLGERRGARRDGHGSGTRVCVCVYVLDVCVVPRPAKFHLPELAVQPSPGFVWSIRG